MSNTLPQNVVVDDVPNTALPGVTQSEVASAERLLFRLGQTDPRVTERALPNQAEKETETGRVRLRWLMPFALSARGERYEVWDQKTGAMVTRDEPLPLRPVIKELEDLLGCGADFIYQLVKTLKEFPGGPQNATAKDMLKSAQGGGKGTSRLDEAKEKALANAVWTVRVDQGLRPGAKALAEIARTLKKDAAFEKDELPCEGTIKCRWNTREIQEALANPYERDHMFRLCGSPDEVKGLNSLLCIDCATMSNKENDVRVLDYLDRDLGPATVVWGINAACRGVWTVLGFPGNQNGFLVGQSFRLALIDKAAQLKEYGLTGEIWPFHGKPGMYRHDGGSEFVNKHLAEALRQRDICPPCEATTPGATPHYRGTGERFNRTAQYLFAEFLKSEHGKSITRPVPGKPNAIGIRLEDLNRALVTWVVKDWHKRSLAALGGDSPLSRWEKFVKGLNGLPMSGVPPAIEDTDELRWELLWHDYRTINHVGIELYNRRYSTNDLRLLFKPNSRSSGKRVRIGFNPYVMGQVFVKVPDGKGERIISVPWKPLDATFRPTTDLAARSKNPTLWEWQNLYRDIVRGNTAKPTLRLMEDMQKHREQQSQNRPRGSGKQKITTAAQEAMRGFAADSCPKATLSPKPQSPSVDQLVKGEESNRPEKPKAPTYLPTGEGGHTDY